MSRKLSRNLTSAYIEAANALAGKRARRKIVAYVESYDDVFFWSNLLRPLENERFYFEVMLPSRTTLGRGKKIALSHQLGPCMVACVDADYDYLMQGSTETSRTVCQSPYVFHTYVYAIENFECYAPTLQNVCVMATLNDRRLFDFEDFMARFSEIIWPLLAWNVWCYRYGFHRSFPMTDFHATVALPELDYLRPEETLEKLRHRVNAKINRLQRQFPQGRRTYKPLCEELLGKLGLTPRTAYLHMRGHDLMDGLVVPLLGGVCDALRREREREIRRLAEHGTQMQNELAAYQHAVAPVAEMLRKQTGYADAPLYRRIQDDVRRFLCRAGDGGREDRKREAAEPAPDVV